MIITDVRGVILLSKEEEGKGHLLYIFDEACVYRLITLNEKKLNLRHIF